MVLWISFKAISLPPFFSSAKLGLIPINDPLVEIDGFPKVMVILTKLKVWIMRCLWQSALRME